MGVTAGSKHSEAGVIPQDWESRPIRSFAAVSAGGTPSRAVPEYWNGNIPWVTTAEINSRTIVETSERITSLGLKNSAAKMLAPGAILLALYGQGKTRGKVAVLGVVATTNQACAAITVSPSVSDSFVYHALNSRYAQIRALSNSGSQDNLSGAIVKAIPIPLPPTKAEQAAIAAALSDADALIESLDQLLAKKRHLKQGAMQELLSGEKRLPSFADDWTPFPFERVLSRLNAKAHQIQTSDYQSTGRYPIVDQGKERVVGYSDRSDKRFPCPEGGVIVFGDHTCVVKFVDFDFVVGADGTQVLVAKNGHDTGFLALQLQFKGIQSTGYNRHFRFLKEREFRVPSAAEQRAIAMVLSDMELEIAALEAKLTKARQIKQGMMQELLTGRIRLV